MGGKGWFEYPFSNRTAIFPCSIKAVLFRRAMAWIIHVISVGQSKDLLKQLSCLTQTHTQISSLMLGSDQTNSAGFDKIFDEWAWWYGQDTTEDTRHVESDSTPRDAYSKYVVPLLLLPSMTSITHQTQKTHNQQTITWDRMTSRNSDENQIFIQHIEVLNGTAHAFVFVTLRTGSTIFF